MTTTNPHPGIIALGNNRFQVKVYDPRTKKRLTPTVTGLMEAKRVQARLKAEVQRVDGAIRPGTPPTVQEFGEAWRKQLRHVQGTATNLEQTLRLYLYPALGDCRVDRVSQPMAATFTKHLAEMDLAPSTRTRIDSQVRTMFTAVVAAKYREASPFSGVLRIKVTRRETLRQEEYTLSMDEALQLADMALAGKAGVEVWAFIRLAVGTGLRVGELLGLTVDELDYPHPTVIDVGHQVQYAAARKANAGGWYLCPPKTEAGLRTVPLAPWVADTLAVLSGHRSPLRVTMPWLDKGVQRGSREVALVIPGTTGGPRSGSGLARTVRELAARAGVGPGRVTPHTLRKTFTTLLGDAGVPLKAIDYVTAHESYGLSLGTYTTVTPAALEKVREATQQAYLDATSRTARAS